MRRRDAAEIWRRLHLAWPTISHEKSTCHATLHREKPAARAMAVYAFDLNSRRPIDCVRRVAMAVRRGLWLLAAGGGGGGALRDV